MNNPLIKLLLLHWREYIREPETIFWTLGFPIMLALALGLAFTRQGEPALPLGLIAGTPAVEQAWQSHLQSMPSQPDAGKFQPRFYATPALALRGIQRGDILLYAQIDPSSGKQRFFFDPQNVTARLAYLLFTRQAPTADSKTSFEALVAPGSRYIDFLIPGLLALGIMNMGLWGIGWAIIDHRIKKMLRRLLATPMRRYQFLLSYFLSRIVLGMIESISLLVFAALVFKVKNLGSWPAFITIYLCGQMAFGGIAILMAARTNKTQVANGLINAISMPMMICSGIFFSYKTFPAWSLPVIQNLPLTTLVDSLRKIMVEGAGMPEIILPSLVLLLTGAACFSLGLKIFRWY